MPGNDPPPLNNEQPVGMRLEDFGKVAAQEYRRSAIPKLNQRLIQRNSRRNVQPAMWLVEQYVSRITDQGADELGLLSHPSGIAAERIVKVTVHLQPIH